jgi:hypothetical protein
MCILSQILQGKRTGHLDCSETGWLTSKTTFMWFEITQLSPYSGFPKWKLEIKLSLLSTQMKKKGQSSFSAQLCDLCGYSQGKPVAPIVLSPTRRAGSLMFHLNSTQESKLDSWAFQEDHARSLDRKRAKQKDLFMISEPLRTKTGRIHPTTDLELPKDNCFLR